MKNYLFYKLLYKISSFSPLLKKIILSFYYNYFHDSIWYFRNFILINSPIKVKCKEIHFKMIPKGHVAKSMWLNDFEPAERDFIYNNLTHGTTVFNIGANSGLYSILCSKLLSNNDKIYAFEPSLSNFNILLKNITINKSINILSYNIALSNSDTNLNLIKDKNHPNLDTHYQVSSEIVNENNFVEFVSATTLDNFIKNNLISSQNEIFLIIDVEGHELQVLKGASELLNNEIKITILIECTIEIEKTIKLLENFNFNVHKLTNESILPSDIDFSSGNYIAIK